MLGIENLHNPVTIGSTRVDGSGESNWLTQLTGTRVGLVNPFESYYSIYLAGWVGSARLTHLINGSNRQVGQPF